MLDIPALQMNNANKIPRMGLGLRLIDAQDVPSVLSQAVALGYRLIDTAQTYGNEPGIGAAIRGGVVDRDDLFITTKIANRNQGRSRTLSSFEDSLKYLGTEAVDLCLVHWPQPMYGQYVDTWRTLVEICSEGRARAIGVSNFTTGCLERIINETGVVPVVNQVELHPQFPQDDLLSLHAERGDPHRGVGPVRPRAGFKPPSCAGNRRPKGKDPGAGRARLASAARRHCPAQKRQARPHEGERRYLGFQPDGTRYVQACRDTQKAPRPRP